MFTITDFEDLVHIIDARPEWRQRLKHALFPETDLEIALRELVESGKRHDKAFAKLESGQTKLENGQTKLESSIAKLESGQTKLENGQTKLESSIAKLENGQTKLENGQTKLENGQTKLESSIAKLESGQAELKQDVSDLKHDMKSVKTDVAKLKGRSQEDFYRQRADSVFGVQLRKGINATGWIADLLHEKVVEGVINSDDVRQVLAADLLWSAETRDSKIQVVVVMEASWYAEEGDVKRALARAKILRRVGVTAIPVVGGEAWSDSAKQTAVDGNVVTTENGRLDETSWSQALQNLA